MHMSSKAKIEEARVYIDAAPNQEERNRRKQEMFGTLYNAGTQKLVDMLGGTSGSIPTTWPMNKSESDNE